MDQIKLLVCCHKPFPVPQNPMLRPVQVGTVFSGERFEGYAHDDEGENISGKNRRYCELTALYWAWKNEEADYYGLFHYRRYLYPDENVALPYCLKQEPTEALLRELGYERFPEVIAGHDLIVPKGEDMHVSVREHYADAPFHHRKDLELAEQILLEKYPEYREAAETYLSGTVLYFGNIMIMEKAVFSNYCEWLFSILDELDRRIDYSAYSPQESRVIGYIAERLLGIYYTKHKNELNTLELPRVHFEADGKTLNRLKRINTLLPPGTKRRALVKKLKQKNRK